MKNQEIVVVKQECHSRGMLSGIFRVLSCCGYQISAVILDLLQDLQRLSFLATLRNNIRGRSQIKFGMTSLFNSGFTLIELLVVVLIIGILTAIALPQYNKAVAKARAVEIAQFLTNTERAIDAYVLANGVEREPVFFAAPDPTAPADCSKLINNNLLDIDVSAALNKWCNLYNLTAACYTADEDSDWDDCYIYMMDASGGSGTPHPELIVYHNSKTGKWRRSCEAGGAETATIKAMCEIIAP